MTAVERPAVTTLRAGVRYRVTTTAKLRGERITREIIFTASRDHEPEPLVRNSATTPDQDRVYVLTSRGSCPMLVVAGSIREVTR